MVTFDKIRAEFLSLLDYKDWNNIVEIIKEPVLLTKDGETFRITIEKLKST